MDVCARAGVAVFKVALLKRCAYRRKYWQLLAAIADIFFPILAGEQRHLQMRSIIFWTARAGLNVSISDLATLPPCAPSTAAAFDDAAAEDMIDAVLVLPLHACMHKAAPALSPPWWMSKTFKRVVRWLNKSLPFCFLSWHAWRGLLLPGGTNF